MPTSGYKPRRRRTHARIAAAAAAAALALPAWAVPAAEADAALAPSAPPCCNLTQAYIDGVRAALRQNTDVWGNDVMSQPDGPTYASVKDDLVPMATGGVATGAATGGANGISDTGYPYLPLTMPQGDTADTQAGLNFGAEHYALHITDGSGIIADWRVPCSAEPAQANNLNNPLAAQAFKAQCPNFWEAQFYVGATGTERYGSAATRLAEPTLLRGYLPVLQTRYTDADGTAYSEQSFAARVPELGSLVSFEHVTVRPAAGASAPTAYRIHLRDPGTLTFALSQNSVTSNGQPYLYFSGHPTLSGNDLVYSVPPNSDPSSIYLVVVNNPDLAGQPDAAAAASLATPTRFDTALSAVADYWNSKLNQGARITVPEPYVMYAMRNLLIQNLVLDWRYSIGNPYQGMATVEDGKAISELGEYGFGQDLRNNLQTILGQSRPRSYATVTEEGVKLETAVQYYQMTRDAGFLDANLPLLDGYLQSFADQVASDPHGLLSPDKCCPDKKTEIGYWTANELTAWRGWRDMLVALRQSGHGSQADGYQQAFDSFTASLHQAIDGSMIRLSDGSLYLPGQLFVGEQPYDTITATRDGSYWNLLNPYALSSGFFPAGSADARGLLSYLDLHGGLFLGLTRFNYRGSEIGTCNPTAPEGYESSGADEVYGFDYVRFLAANDLADRQDLTMYSVLAHALTRNTFLVGEGENIDPCGDAYYRGTWLSPVSANNDVFLESLRDALVHEVVTDSGVPSGLNLAFATPRDWLSDGKHVDAGQMPTLLGNVSYDIRSALRHDRISATVQLPKNVGNTDVRIRLRAPAGYQLVGATVGRRAGEVDPATDTIDLSGHTGTVQIVARYIHNS